MNLSALKTEELIALHADLTVLINQMMRDGALKEHVTQKQSERDEVHKLLEQRGELKSGD